MAVLVKRTANYVAIYLNYTGLHFGISSIKTQCTHEYVTRTRLTTYFKLPVFKNAAGWRDEVTATTHKRDIFDIAHCPALAVDLINDPVN